MNDQNLKYILSLWPQLGIVERKMAISALQNVLESEFEPFSNALLQVLNVTDSKYSDYRFRANELLKLHDTVIGNLAGLKKFVCNGVSKCPPNVEFDQIRNLSDIHDQIIDNSRIFLTLLNYDYAFMSVYKCPSSDSVTIVVNPDDMTPVMDDSL